MKKTALITGGTRGIGLGIALKLANLGYDLAINGLRTEKEVSKALDELLSVGNSVSYFPGNISNSNERKEIVTNVLSKFGAINVLVNNAGVAPKERKDILETSEESFDHVLNVNLKGTFFLTQLVANHMIEVHKNSKDEKFSIINISSISATIASVNRGEYCISKAGLAMVTSLFATRLGKYDIPVYEIRPGIIETDMTAEVKDKYDKLIKEGLMIQARWGQPKDIGDAVAALVSGDFPYSTGHVFMLDGGLSIPRL